MFISNLDILKNQSKEMMDAVFYFNLYNGFGDAFVMIDLLFSLLPTIIVNSIFADRIAMEIEKSAAYIFTRTSKRKRWMLKITFKLFLQLTGITVFFYFVQLIFFGLSGFYIEDLYTFVIQSLYLLSIIFLENFLLVLLSNVLVMKLGEIWGYIISVSAYCVSVIFIYMIPVNFKAYLHLMPFAQKYTMVSQWSNSSLFFPLWQHSSIEGNYLKILEISFVYIFAVLFWSVMTIRKKEFY
jgi:hypothetical protein